MAVDAISPFSSTSETREAKAGPKQDLDKEAFLKLLVAQISHQDPLKPMEGTEFVAQLSQFAVVEQAMSQSAKLDLLSTQMGGLANNEATSLVGKSVTLRGKTVAFDGLVATSAGASLGASAEKVTVTLRDAEGRVVRTMNLGSRPAGGLSITWDGKDDAGNTAARGAYTVEVKATGKNGESVPVNSEVSGTVVSVSFEKGYPELTLDSDVSAPVSDLVSVKSGATAK